MKKLILLAAIAACFATGCGRRTGGSFFLASTTPEVVSSKALESGGLSPADTLARGSLVESAAREDIVKMDDVRYIPIYVGDEIRYVDESLLVPEADSVVLERIIYPKVSVSIIDDTLSSHICDFAGKGSELKVLGYDRVMPDGRVHRYKVRHGKKEGWVFGKYAAVDREQALKRYDAFDGAHGKVRNSFKGGEAMGCEFEPYEKPVFTANRHPSPCNAFYLNINPANLRNIDAYLDLADSTKINAFILDIKDNTCPGYKAEAMQKYSPTNYERAEKGKEELYKTVVDKIHARGYYAIARITCFKDSYYAKDHPDRCILDKRNGQPILMKPLIQRKKRLKFLMLI